VRSPRACRAVWPLPPCYCSLLQAGEKVSPRPGSSHSSPFAAPVQPVQPRRRNLTNKKPTACFLLSAASRAARRGLTGTLSFPPAPSLPNLRVVPITLCPPSTVPDFEQSAPIRVGDQGKKVNVDPSHRSPSVIHRVLPQVNRRLRAFYVLTEIVMKYIIRVTVHTKCSVTAKGFLAEGCTLPVYHHLDVRTDCAPQVQTLPNVCAV
jgi:hypothetical protein